MLREARVQTAIRCQLIDLPLAPARWLLGTRSQGGVTERSGLIGMAVQATVWAAIHQPFFAVNVAAAFDHSENPKSNGQCAPPGLVRES
jgi:hypothetical protein